MEDHKDAGHVAELGTRNEAPLDAAGIQTLHTTITSGQVAISFVPFSNRVDTDSSCAVLAH